MIHRAVDGWNAVMFIQIPLLHSCFRGILTVIQFQKPRSSRSISIWVLLLTLLAEQAQIVCSVRVMKSSWVFLSSETKYVEKPAMRTIRLL